MNVIALDIETKNLDMESEGLEFSKPHGWQVSCVSIWDASLDRHNEYNYADLAEIPDDVRKEHRVESFQTLRDDLAEWFNNDYLLITKNGAKFDLPIICKSVEDGGCGVRDIINSFIVSDKHLDLQVWLEDATQGLRFSLQNLVKSVLGKSESKLMEAQFAPEEWANENYEDVIRYCAKDAELTYRVWEVARRKGTLQAMAKNPDTGKNQNCLVRIHW